LTEVRLSRINMNDGAFQWDDTKAAKNYAKHGVTFEAARNVFKDPFALDWADDGQDEGEQRFATLGVVECRCCSLRIP
jgi:uncharacterized DUF497 family protein